jgi:hypothetical protein
MYVYAVSLALATCLTQSATTKLAPQKGWHANLATARALAQQSGKPLMVVFRCDP